MIKESLRLWPPFVSINRVISEDTQIMNYDVPQNTEISVRIVLFFFILKYIYFEFNWINQSFRYFAPAEIQNILKSPLNLDQNDSIPVRTSEYNVN